jgi:hypothetical protein
MNLSLLIDRIERPSLSGRETPMPRKPWTLLRVTSAILFATTGLAARADDPKPPAGRAYSLTAESDAVITSPNPQDKPLQINGWTRIDYFLDRNPAALDVLVHSLALTMKQNGRLSQKTSMSRTRFRHMPQPGAETVDVPFEKGPAGLQAVLGTFDVPIVSLKLDASGREVSRNVRIEEQDKAKGLVAIAEMIVSLHAPFATGSATWEAPVSIAIGEGQSSKGTLKFEKVGQPSQGIVKVRVSGQLALTGAMGQGQFKNGLYVVSGEQLYDTAAKEWKSGKWTMNISADMVNASNDKPIGSMKGTMVVTMGAPESIKTPADALPNEPARPKVKT